MDMRPTLAASVILAGFALGACSPRDEARSAAAPARPAPAPAAPAPAAAHAPADAARGDGIAWKQAASDAEVDAAFALARREQKPVFLYWGAKWCPPCNQVQATLFNRVDFIERSRAFVPVYIDGDRPGAQKLGNRFKVSGYPTMVLFSPGGAELTRLPGEVDPQQYTQLLTLGMNAQRPVKDVLADAQAGGRGLSPNDWKLLAFYSWETDEQQVVPKDRTPAVLAQLAAACPADPPETASRLLLKAVAAADPKAGPRRDAAAREKVLKILADAPAARAQMDVLANAAADITRALSAPGTPGRAALVAAFETTLRRLEADATLSRADRLTALLARVDLAKIDAPKEAKPALPPALLDEVRAHAARADREITDGYERQAVVTAAAYMLATAGLLDDSDALLKGNLAKSHSPYYLMSQLASNAKKRGDPAGALRWHEEAFARAEGPATRLQWGASYVNALVELAPQDEARIERAVDALLAEAAAQPHAFYERSARSLQRMGGRIAAWNEGSRHAAVMQRLRAKLDDICTRLPADEAEQRRVCLGLLEGAKNAKT